MPYAARATGAKTGSGPKEHTKMIRKQGFTLIELLVVIAIISILAAIVTPRVQGYILKARMTNTVAEIQSIELAITKMVTDAGKSSPRQLFKNAPDAIEDGSNPAVPVTNAQLQTDIGNYTQAFYSLLRQGRMAADAAGVLPGGLILADGVRDKLATSYLDADLDGWDRQYQFWAGPWGQLGVIPFRAYRAGITDPSDDVYHKYEYSDNNIGLQSDGTTIGPVNRKDEADLRIPGNPPLDNGDGFPAPKDLGIYIFSVGVNATSDQLYGTQDDPTFMGGGDDINNWDKEQGWSGFYS